MSLAHRYPDFGKENHGPVAPAGSSSAGSEDASLETFEKGYQAGWDDAAAAHKSEQADATLALSQGLNELSFTHQEAYAKLALSLKPLMSKLVTTLLPDVTRQALGAQVIAQIDLMFQQHGQDALEIAIAPEGRALMEELLNEHLDLPFALAEEPTLSAGQAYIRVREEERHINLDALLKTVTDAVEAFFDAAKKEADHG